MRLRRALLIAIPFGAAALAPLPASGQTAASSAPRHLFEYWFGPSLVSSSSRGTITADHQATLEVGDSQGRAVQKLTFHAPRHLGVEGGIGLFPSKRFGIEVRLNYVSRDLSGSSGPYRVVLDYTAIQPPDDIPRDFHLEDSISWPAPQGTSTELIVSFDGAVRWEAGPRLSGTAGGGLSYFRVKGRAESLAFTQYTLGGQSVLLSSTYAMALSYGTKSALGFDIGGGAGVTVAGPLDLMMDFRYFHAGIVTPDVRVSGFADASRNHGDLALSTVAARMAPIKASVDPSFARLFFGVRIRS